jgi:hypothetical protein
LSDKFKLVESLSERPTKSLGAPPPPPLAATVTGNHRHGFGYNHAGLRMETPPTAQEDEGAPEVPPLHNWQCCLSQGSVTGLDSYTPTSPEAGTRIAMGSHGYSVYRPPLYVGCSLSGGLTPLDGPQQLHLATFSRSEDGVPFIVSGSLDGTLRIFNGDTLELVHMVRHPQIQQTARSLSTTTPPTFGLRRGSWQGTRGGDFRLWTVIQARCCA